MTDPQVRAVVVDVVRPEDKAPYAVTRREDTDELVTITLQKRYWREGDDPESGDTVLLSKFRKTGKGWRAMSGRFFRPSDEQPATSNQEPRDGNK